MPTIINAGRLNIPVNQSLPPGKKMFEAKVTENISEGYTIETVIDGKPLRGILFLNKPISLYTDAHTCSRYVFLSSSPHQSLSLFNALIVLSTFWYTSLFQLMLNSPSRKRTVGEIDSVVSNGIHPNQFKTPKVVKQNQMENREASRGDCSECHEHRTESIAVLMSSNPMTANPSDTHKVKLFSLLLLVRVLEDGLSNE